MAGKKLKKVDLSKQAERVWNNLDEDIKLAVTLYVMEALVEHAQGGGSYRHLIYGRLGFSTKAYSYLYPAGMTISNNFNIENDFSDEG